MTNHLGGRPPVRIPRARCERYLAEGLTLAQIGEREGWSAAAVKRHIAGLGLQRPSRARVTLADIEAVLAGREAVKDVCTRLGVSRAAVHQMAHRRGLYLGRRPAPTAQLSLPFREAA